MAVVGAVLAMSHNWKGDQDGVTKHPAERRPRQRRRRGGGLPLPEPVQVDPGRWVASVPQPIRRVGSTMSRRVRAEPHHLRPRVEWERLGRCGDLGGPSGRQVGPLARGPAHHPRVPAGAWGSPAHKPLDPACAVPGTCSGAAVDLVVADADAVNVTPGGVAVATGQSRGGVRGRGLEDVDGAAGGSVADGLAVEVRAGRRQPATEAAAGREPRLETALRGRAKATQGGRRQGVTP